MYLISNGLTVNRRARAVILLEWNDRFTEVCLREIFRTGTNADV